MLNCDLFLSNNLEPNSGLGIIVILILSSAFFSASETAINFISPAKVRNLIEEKIRGANHLDWLKKNYHKTIIAILVGNNVVNIAAATIATFLVTEYYDSAYLGLATGVLTIAVLLFGEIIPKSLASVHAQTLALFFAPMLRVIVSILSPLIYLFDILVKFVLKLLGAPKQMQVTDQELIAMASIGAEEGSIEKEELELIENALDFNDIPVEGVMTPRVHIDAIPESFKLDEAAEFAVNHPHTRIPVYRETIDHIVGILSIKELLKQYHTEEKPEEISLRQIQLMIPIKVAGNLPIDDLFHEFKKKRMHMAVVLDEYGGTAGIVTMEDLLEELVGDIEDEQDMFEKNIEQIKNGAYELTGRTELDEITELTGLEFDHPGYKTVSFLIVNGLGHLPKEGETLTIGDWDFTVLKKWRNTMLKILLQKRSR